MDYVIGVDGGGTKSLLHMSDLSGNRLLEFKGGPLNLYSTGAAEVERVLTELLSEAMTLSGSRISDCKAICLGNAGLDRPSEQELFQGILARIGVVGSVILTNDAETALVGGCGKLEGVVVISGTGSLAFGRDQIGNRARSGGWGHRISDEGSGYDIGVRAIAAAFRSYDGREPHSQLMNLILQEVGMEQIEQMLPFVYQKAEKPPIAALAKVVNAAHLAGDRKAGEILEHAADELCLMADSVIRKLRFENKPVSLVCSGSVFSHIDYVFHRFVRGIAKAHPQAEVLKPLNNAAYGAAKMALISI
ncbi:BadF/BadG/BcrA/BcrD ATPase family protein [Cohnella boryungensis]|uniref:BadF/BadG/BcrA/BcrD ATPase family protein n=1 Tax=Cohnella boryungensis TaxID=768479 RepID=A0ABV8SB99_9BACL